MARSRLSTLVLAASALVLLPTSARADGAKVPVVVRKRWKVGDVVTRTTKSTGRQQIKVMADDAQRFASDVKLVTEAERVEQCLEADADGHRTRTRVYFRTWSQTKVNGATDAPVGEDTSLAGVTIEVVRATPKWTWKLVGSDAISKEGTEWLDQAFGDSEEAREELFEPGRPVAVGETWNADPAKVAAAFGSQLAVDPAKASATITLEQASGRTGTLVMKATMPTKYLKNRVLGSDDPWKEGGDAHLELRASGPIDGSPAGVTLHSTFSYKGVAASAKGEIHLDVSSEGENVTKAGGTIPEPKPPTPHAPTK
jgi:hypothetical protein